MHRDKTIARILLIFSVVNVALAAPAVVRQRRMDVAEAASGKRGYLDEATDGSGSEPVSEPVSDSDESHQLMKSASDPHLSALGFPSGSSHQDSPPESFHEGSVSSIYPPWWPFSDANSPTYRNTALAKALAQRPAASTVYPAWWPFGDENSPTYRGSSLALSPASSHTGSGSSIYPSWWPHSDDSDENSKTSGYHDFALASPSGSSHQDATSESSDGSSDYDPATKSSPSSSLHPDLAPPDSTALNDALKKKLKIYAVLGTAASIFAGVSIYAVQKETKESHSP